MIGRLARLFVIAVAAAGLAAVVLVVWVLASLRSDRP